MKLESVLGVTYSDAAPVAYLKYQVKEAGSSSRVFAQRLTSDAAISDPVANTRSFNEPMALWINGGTVFDVQVGDVHTVSACIQSSAGNSASGAFMLTGTYITPPPAAARAENAAKKESSEKESSSESDPTLKIREADSAEQVVLRRAGQSAAKPRGDFGVLRDQLPRHVVA